MVRVRTGPTRRRRHKRILKMAKGYRGARSRRFRAAKEAVLHSLVYAYMHRREKKRQFRSWWIQRISAALHAQPISYNQFIHGLKKAGVELNRPILAQLAVEEPAVFEELVEIARKQVGK